MLDLTAFSSSDFDLIFNNIHTFNFCATFSLTFVILVIKV
jgi:hypothetical protein